MTILCLASLPRWSVNTDVVAVLEGRPTNGMVHGILTGGRYNPAMLPSLELNLSNN